MKRQCPRCKCDGSWRFSDSCPQCRKQATCLHCGKEFVGLFSRTTGKQRRLYCSMICANKDERTIRARKVALGKALAVVCSGCAITFEPKRTRHSKYCSRSCASAHRSKEQRLCSCGSKFYAYRNARRCPDCWTLKRSQQLRLCKVCRDRPARRRMLACSQECADLYKKVQARAYYESYYSKVKTHKREERRRTFKAKCKLCMACHKTFTTQYGVPRKRYCSNQCSRYAELQAKSSANRGRKAKIKESINPLDIFRRDKWTCHICGIHTPRKLRGTIDDCAPELDHIIPLSVGGHHTWWNVACCCRRCNYMKGARVKGQLGLELSA